MSITIQDGSGGAAAVRTGGGRASPLALVSRLSPAKSFALFLVVVFVIAAPLSLSRLKAVALATAASVLETRFTRPVLRDDDQITGIISLGGGLQRAQEAVRLALRFPHATLMLSGPGFDEEEFARSYSGLAGRLVIDEGPKNTFENALSAKTLSHPASKERWMVVTSAVHMPRAMGAFRAAGLTVEPWPVYDAPADKTIIASVVGHEILGLIAYRLMGQSEAFFPGP
jgi:uncharacterized SAM-binding protein YcdF (DUF218 family)